MSPSDRRHHVALHHVALHHLALHHVVMPLLTPFDAPWGREVDRSVVVVEVCGRDGVTGWGECSALSRPAYTAEYTAGAFAVLADHFAPAVVAASDEAGRECALAGPGHPMARAALRDALLDRRLRVARRSLSSHLGAVRTAVERTAVIGCGGGVDAFLTRADEAVAAGARAVKAKVAGPGDVAALAALRKSSPDLALAADLNGSARGCDARDLIWADQLGLMYLEQPEAPEDLVAGAALASRLETPIALDESIDSLATARTAFALGALEVLNVKPSRVGGLQAAAALLDWAVDHGVPAFCGGMVELGVGRAGAAAVAALDGCTLPTDLGPSAAYVIPDLTDAVGLDGEGRLVVPIGPGLGVEPQPDRLAAVTRARVVVTC